MKDRKKSADKPLEAALRYLARREHSCAELEKKLGAKGYSEQELADLLARLVEMGYQSDERFTQMVIRHRCAALHGPRKVGFELKGHRISDSMRQRCENELEPDWFDAAFQFARKKTRGIAAREMNFRARAKLNKQLYARGFTSEQISHAINGLENDNHD